MYEVESERRPAKERDKQKERTSKREWKNAQIRPKNKTIEMLSMLNGDCGEEQETISSALLFSA